MHPGPAAEISGRSSRCSGASRSAPLALSAYRTPQRLPYAYGKR